LKLKLSLAVGREGVSPPARGRGLKRLCKEELWQAFGRPPRGGVD